MVGNNIASSGCVTIDYIVNGVKHYKPKKKYLTDKEAIYEAAKINAREGSIHKIVPYKCKECGYWHLGHHSKRLLTDKDRLHFKEMVAIYNGKLPNLHSNKLWR